MNPAPETSQAEKDSRYSLDEMMQVLREGERNKDEEGELVTREDGTVVRRVRRRKRRSQQSKRKEEQQKKKRTIILQVIALVSAVALIAAYLGFVFFRLNSSAYSEKMEQDLAEWLGAEVAVEGLSVSPSAASANEFALTWENDFLVKSFKARKIVADTRVKDFLQSRFQGVDIGAAVGELLLQMPENPASVVKKLPVADYPYPFDLYYCEALNVRFGGEDSPLAIRGSDTTYRFLTGSGHQVVLQGGELALAGWSPLPIENGTLTFHDGIVDLVGLRLGAPDSQAGKINLRGSVPVENEAEYHLAMTVEDYPLEHLLGQHLGQLLTGRIDSEQGVLHFQQGDARPREIAVPFTGESLSLKKLPFLSVLDELFPDEGFLDPSFEEGSTAVFHWNQQGMGLKSLKLRLTSKMRIDGHLLAGHDGLLLGEFQLKINKGILARQPIFQNNPGVTLDEEDTGYAIIKVKVGGTVDEPSDNFRQVIGMDNLLNTPPSEKAEGDFKSLFEELTTQPRP